MGKGLAYLCLVVITLAIAGADLFILTSTATISGIAERQIDEVFGPQLEHGPVTAGLDGGGVLVEVRRVGLNLKDVRVLSADRVEVRLASKGGSYVPQSVTLTEPRITLDQRLLEPSAGGAGGRPLREVYPHDLPRLRCIGGQFEIIHHQFFHWSTPPTFAIQELTIVPVAGFRCFVAGSLRSEIFGDWRITGEFDADGGAMHLALVSEEANIGSKVRAVLAPSLLPEWDRYRPEGRARVRVTIDADPGQPARFRATVEPLGMSICYEGFPYAVDDAKGELDFFADHFVIKYLNARSGGARIRFDGSAGGYGAEADFKFRIEIDSMPIDEKLRAALSPSARAVYDKFQPSGTIDVRGQVIREYGLDKPVRNPLDITFRDSAFRYLPFPYEITGVRGNIHIESPRVEVLHLAGNHRSGALQFEGVLDDVDTDPIIDLRIRGQNISLDPELKNAIPKETRAIWDRFSPMGPVDTEWHVTKAKGEEAVHRSETTARGCSVNYEVVPLPASEVTGQVSYGPEEVRLINLAGKVDPGEVTVSGSAIQTPDGLRHHYEISAFGVRLDERFRQAMPKSVAAFLNTLKLSGTANFRMVLDMSGQGPTDTTSWTLRLELHHGIMDTALRFDEIDGVVDFLGSLKDGRISGTGTLSLNNARIMKKKVTDASASFTVQGDLVTFNTMKASAYGGTISGSLQFNMATTEIIGGNFTGDRLDLREYVRDVESFPNRVLAGKVNFEVHNLGGRGDSLESLTGEGTSTITDGQLFEVPAISRIFKIFSTTKRFDAGKIDFDIGGRRFKLKSFGFQSKDGSLIGRGGWVDFDGNYHLRLRVEPAPVLGIDFFFTNFLSSVFSQLMRTTIDGNLESTEAKEKVEKETPEPPKEEEGPPPPPPAPTPPPPAPEPSPTPGPGK